MSELCEAFGISRKTGYKRVERYRKGVAGLFDLPRALWGPKKIVAQLRRRQPELAWPAASTPGQILKRHGLVKGRWRTCWRGCGNGPWPEPDAANAVWTADHKGWFRTRLRGPMQTSQSKDTGCTAAPLLKYRSDLGWILGVAFLGMLTRSARPARGFTCVRCCSTPRASSPHGLAARAVAFSLRLLQTRSAEDLHLLSRVHAGHTKAASRRLRLRPGRRNGRPRPNKETDRTVSSIWPIAQLQQRTKTVNPSIRFKVLPIYWLWTTG